MPTSTSLQIRRGRAGLAPEPPREGPCSGGLNGVCPLARASQSSCGCSPLAMGLAEHSGHEVSPNWPGLHPNAMGWTPEVLASPEPEEGGLKALQGCRSWRRQEGCQPFEALGGMLARLKESPHFIQGQAIVGRPTGKRLAQGGFGLLHPAQPQQGTGAEFQADPV